MLSQRKPYPFPEFQNDDNFVGPRSTMKAPYTQPAHLAQQSQPWNKLFTTPTLSSARREVYHHDPKAPRDSLDFVLTAEYNHHNEFLKGHNETLVQPETLGTSDRKLKNREVIVPPAIPALGHPLKVTELKKKQDLNCVDNIIEGPHTQTTNRGYSRKPDGGFFTS